MTPAQCPSDVISMAETVNEDLQSHTLHAGTAILDRHVTYYLAGIETNGRPLARGDQIIIRTSESLSKVVLWASGKN